MQSGRITEVISSTSYLPETLETPPIDEITGINYSTEHLNTTTRVFYDDDEQTGQEIENPTGESINNLRMQEIIFIDNSIQRLTEELEFMENDNMGNFTMDDINHMESRINDLIDRRNEVRRSISADV